MKLALECGSSLLDYVQPFADFDFILAQEALKDEEYAKFYRDSDRIKFLDNGTNEEGEPLSLEELKEVAEDLKVNYIVSPDWMGDMAKTVEAYSKAVEMFGTEKLICVLQGSTPLEALQCLKYYSPDSLLSVPYKVGGSIRSDSPSVMATRRALVVSNLPTDRQIHLFGLTTLDELQWYTTQSNIVSLDTGIPVSLGLRSLDILDDIVDRSKPSFEVSRGVELSGEGWTAICRNIALLRKAMAN